MWSPSRGGVKFPLQGMKMDKNIGKEAKDKITGFKGIIIGRADYLFGCSQYGLSPKIDKEGKVGVVNWFDEGRVEIIGKGIDPKEVKADKNGGPNSDAPKGRY